MRTTVQLPGVSKAVSSLIVHYLAVFGVAFLTQLLAGYTGVVNESTLLSLLTSAGAAGVIAVIHVIIGIIPATPSTVGISLKVKNAGYQILTSAAVVFVSILGAALIGGATHITSLPDAVAVLIAAISAAVTAVVQYFVGLVPAPKG